MSEAKLGLLLALLPLGGLLSLLTGPVVRRWGDKRVCVAAIAARSAWFGAIVPCPWVLDRYGPTATLAYAAAVLAGVAVIKALSDSAYLAWNRRFVPDAVRGRFNSMQIVMVTLAQTVRQLRAVAESVSAAKLGPTASVVLWGAMEALEAGPELRVEYVALCVHALEASAEER